MDSKSIFRPKLDK